MAREIRLDVSDLEPCEPLARALAAAGALGAGEYVRLILRREPLPLYAHLEARRVAHLHREGGPAGHLVFFWRQADAEAEAAARAAAGAA